MMELLFAVGLFITSSILVGAPSLYLLIHPEFADKHDLASIIDLIHDWLPNPWNRRLIQGTALLGIVMSLGFLWMGLSILF